MPAPVNEQDPGRLCPELDPGPCCSSSRRGVDKLLEMQWCDVSQRLAILFACAPAGYSAELLSAQGPERLPVPVAAAGTSPSSPSSVVSAPAIPVPPGPVTAPVDGDRHSVLPGSMAPSSSRSSDGAS